MIFPVILCAGEGRGTLLALQQQLSLHFPNYTIETLDTASSKTALLQRLEVLTLSRLMYRW